MSFFPIPPEVLWEMSMDLDIDDVEAVVNGYDGRLPSARELEALSDADRGFVSCPHCGTRNLGWIQTTNGPELAYTNRWGKLNKKLHACPE